MYRVVRMDRISIMKIYIKFKVTEYKNKSKKLCNSFPNQIPIVDLTRAFWSAAAIKFALPEFLLIIT